ncbi:hypothetical protein AMAG_15348 [Allomyces macrogynus ATCC 38327]|uniref:Leucine-binding protein domain-containing protein n=1 Tax=Allomyces macrogynus (strain ATCC 38327) TaxID=578462 RepID=A0A0L0T982_ALLM3|nr:hypothetical protein AMAG_15348 [Allomyces macrogynus ATCC 38327]|eukprot:KNE71099.1 hypothetical protein AMAG_15348 [Allomyces macrogynus ATCC 38327]
MFSARSYRSPPSMNMRIRAMCTRAGSTIANNAHVCRALPSRFTPVHCIAPGQRLSLGASSLVHQQHGTVRPFRGLPTPWRSRNVLFLLAITLLLVVSMHVARAELVFGSSADLSTASATLNRGVHDGIRAAFREINVAGGVRGQNLTFISLDDGYNATRSLQNTLNLLQNYSLVGILAPSGSNSISTWLPMAKNYSMPVYFMNSGNSIFRTPFDRSIVHLQAGTSDEVMAHVHYALKVLLHRHIAIVYQDDLFGCGCFGNALAALNHVGLAPWAIGEYPLNAQNVTAVLDALLPAGSKPPQSVVMCGLAKQASLTISGFRARSPAPTAFFLISGATIQEVQATIGQRGDFANIYFTSSAPNPHDTPSPLIARVRQALVAYNASLTMPLHGHVLGYTAGRLLHQALQRIDSSVPITPTVLNDIFMTTSMFNVDGLQIGPYLDDGATACNQGLRTVWMAQLTATSWIGLPRGTFSWTGCLADPSSLSLPILWGTILSQMDPVEIAFQQGPIKLNAATHVGIWRAFCLGFA